MVERSITRFSSRDSELNKVTSVCTHCSVLIPVGSGFGVDTSKGFVAKPEYLGWFCTWSCYDLFSKNLKQKQLENFITQDVYD